MLLVEKDITKLDRVNRLKLINSICGIRSVHLIGTKSSKNTSNLAIFSSVTHLGSNPALLGFVSRPMGKVDRHTISNIKSSTYYTINSVQSNTLNRAHQTSGKYKSEVSEFESCSLTEEYISSFSAPFVLESNIKLGMKLVDIIKIKYNGTFLVVGEIKLIKYNSDNLEENFHDCLGVIGLNTYYLTKKHKNLDYVRITN